MFAEGAHVHTTAPDPGPRRADATRFDERDQMNRPTHANTHYLDLYILGILYILHIPSTSGLRNIEH